MAYHCVVTVCACSESGKIRRVMMWGGAEVVFPSWIVECSRQRQAVSTKEHLVSAEFFLRGRTNPVLMLVTLSKCCVGATVVKQQQCQQLIVTSPEVALQVKSGV